MADIPTRIRRVELRVSDPETSAAFYSAVTGLDATGDGERQELSGPSGGEPILTLHRAAKPGMAPRRAAGLFHTAFRFRERAGLASALRRLARELEDIDLTGASDHGVSEALYLDDPDGLGIELYRDRPIDEWPSPQGEERVHMFSAPLDLQDLLAADTGLDAGTAALAGIDIGHVHLKVADPEAAIGFWTGAPGMELMARFGPDAAFLGADGYHHHIGANSWQSRGASLEPADGSGLELVAIGIGVGAGNGDSGEHRTPDGVRILLEPGGEGGGD